jgi:tRNA 2-thiouridine synthesizing protein A
LRLAIILNRTDFEMQSDAQSQSEWDAGMMGCGELILELRRRLNELTPGAVLTLTARDPGVPEDLPAWCRMTGHRLIRAEPPEFMIERKRQ